VKDLFKLIFKSNKNTPPEGVKQAFEERYRDAVSVEWHQDDNFFESIFVYRGKETISRFSKSSEWLESRINQELNEISAEIRANLSRFGEIMSSIRIEKPHSTVFEFVIRDKEMNRQIIFTSPEGVILDQEGFNSVFDLS
jgi:hypothetical protein